MEGDGVRSGFKKIKCGEFGEGKVEAKACGFRANGGLTESSPSKADHTAKSNHLPFDDSRSFVQDTSNICSLENTQEIKSKKMCSKPNISGLDLNKDVLISFNSESLHRYKNYERDALSECGSTCGSMGETEPMKIWKQMKQNGFLSSSHGGVTILPMPKPRGRKKGNDIVIKKKIEIAKREQVDRFTKAVAPNGLLNDLNPGIINHVRNRKQVHSIIENLVRSSRNKSKNSELKKDDETQNYSCGSQKASVYSSTNGDSGLTEREAFARSKTSYHSSLPNKECENDALALKLSSASTMASENMSCLSNDGSVNISSIDSLSVKAASVASQWLELLHQDITGRLAALRHSKKRVREATEIELPFLISSELSSNQENDSPAVHSTNKANSEMHKLRWTAIFNQMDKSLLDEEKNLENSLNQVWEMLLHCEHGLVQYPPTFGLQQEATLQNNCIFPKAELALDKDLAVRAAAAAIYSTFNFLQPTENLPCF